MKNLLKFFKKQKGQALSEYVFILPGIVFIVWGAAGLVGGGAADVYRHVTSVIQGQNECVPQYDHEDNSICDESEFCEKIEYEDEDSGSFRYDGALSIDAVVIKAGKTYEVRRDDPFQFTYITDDGCYRVTFKTNKIDWERTGEGNGCQSVSHIDHWQSPICLPE